MFLPENIDLAQPEKYCISIRLAPNGFSFYFSSPNNPDVFHFQKTELSNKLTYSENIQKLIFDLGFFNHSFKKTTVVIVSPHYTLVPQQFFENKRSKEIMDFNFHDLSGISLHDSLDDKGYSVIFNMNEEVHSFLVRHLTNPVFTHHTSTLLQIFDSYGNSKNSKRCFVNFHDGFISTFCYSEDKLLSSNTFSADNNPDTTYYIASIWERLVLDQTKDFLFLSGEIDSYLSVADELKRLFHNTEIVELTPKSAITEEQMQSLPTDVIATQCV